jgi:uncharacterized protein YybS (DUF2232 family)
MMHEGLIASGVICGCLIVLISLLVWFRRHNFEVQVCLPALTLFGNFALLVLMIYTTQQIVQSKRFENQLFNIF